ncbi:TIGR03086 family metal-binding protein [Pseudonocardia sp. GCM10023141]|uniref:TIGR03086 family metal-binding protein n=1 Tax=Pseudonocardia sp. GCM10023141 TaxID=3252653 RepID=UPI003621022A
MQVTVDVREIYARSSAGFAAAVHAVGDRWTAPTVLPGWDVRELVNHLVNEQRWAPELFAGATVEEVGTRFDGDLLGSDPLATFDAAEATALAAVRAPGAVEGVVHLSFGDRPGFEYTMQLSADHLVHTWDLARAIGADETLDAEVVAAVLDWFGDTESLYRDIGVIGPRVEVPAGASRQDQLLGRFGRTP